MRNLTCSFIILICLIFISPLAAQTVSITPYYGYLIPKMTSVNNLIEFQIDSWSEILEDQISSPGKINGSREFGIQIQYPLDNTYFLNINVSYYQEKIETEHLISLSQPPDRFYFNREVELYTAIISLNHFFSYSPRRRFNYYIGLGAGYSFTKALSTTTLSLTDIGGLDGTIVTPGEGEFSGSTLSGVIKGGFDYRLLNFISLWGEAGVRVANFGQLNGTATSIENPELTDTTTSSSFDFTGPFIRAGLGISLPFLK